MLQSYIVYRTIRRLPVGKWLSSRFQHSEVKKTSHLLLKTVPFCVWGLTGREFLFGEAKRGLSAEGAKLRLPKEEALTTRESRERRKLRQRGLGLRPRHRRDFEDFMPKLSTFFDPVSLTF